MDLRFRTTAGEQIPKKDGLPVGYKDIVFPATNGYHFQSENCTVIVQEKWYAGVIVRSQSQEWLTPGRILCENDHRGLMVKTVSQGTHHEYFKGADQWHLSPGHFGVMIGRQWTNLQIEPAGTRLVSLEILYDEDSTVRILSSSHPLAERLQRMQNGYPDLLFGPSDELNREMKQLIKLLGDGKKTGEAESDNGELTDQLLTSTLLQMNNTPLILMIGRNEKERINRCREIIVTNLDKHYTTKELGRQIGMNEFRLKWLFKRITGFTIDEYRKYFLLHKVRDEVLASDRQLKTFFNEAGFKSFSAFIDGFKRYMNCTPGELRENRWETGGIGLDLEK